MCRFPPRCSLRQHISSRRSSDPLPPKHGLRSPELSLATEQERAVHRCAPSRRRGALGAIIHRGLKFRRCHGTLSVTATSVPAASPPDAPALSCDGVLTTMAPIGPGCVGPGRRLHAKGRTMAGSTLFASLDSRRVLPATRDLATRKPRSSTHLLPAIDAPCDSNGPCRILQESGAAP